ncbi:hypothetical protein IHE46_12360 [Rhodanobacter sp. DHG33]|nr:hypothetical protein [Rhodanobacter sp. DHG33]MBD8899757.1 hypothetical protein [Rhodanobacter sp. DHG33]
MRQLRWREPPPGRRLAWLVLLVVALLHLVFAVMTWYAMHPQEPVPAEQSTTSASDVLEVRFISAAHAPAAKPVPPLALPPPPARAPVRATAKRVAEPASKNASSEPPPAPAPAASVAPPRLFDSSGAAILPAAASSAAAPEYVQHMPQGDTRIMQHTSPVKYKPTPFDKDWGHGSNAVDDALQKAVDKTTVKHTFDLGHGIHIHCGVSLVGLGGGCGGDPPSPPPPKDGDVRMNMAPAKPLAPNPHAPPPPPLSKCIALYRAGQPLAEGCPSDTPLRAVDEEVREQREKQAKQAAGH